LTFAVKIYILLSPSSFVYLPTFTKEVHLMQQITCKKTMYWRQVPHYSGSLTERSEPDPELVEREQITEVFTAGKKYPITIQVGGGACGDVDIAISAQGNDGKNYTILAVHDALLSNRNVSNKFVYN